MQETLQPWRIAVGDLEVHGWRSGFSGRPIVCFLHGNGLCVGAYWAMLRRCQSRFDWVLLDLPGHGQSTELPHLECWNDLAEVAGAALSQLIPHAVQNRVILTGHSLGAVVSLLIARQRPELGFGLVMLDPVLLPSRLLLLMQVAEWAGIEVNSQMAKRARRRKRSWPDRESARASFLGRGMFRQWHAESLESYLHWALVNTADGVELRCRPETEARIFATRARGQWTSLRTLTRTAWMLYGADSYPFVIESAGKARRVAPALQPVALPGSHFFMLESPERAAEAFLVALEALVSTAPQPISRGASLRRL